MDIIKELETLSENELTELQVRLKITSDMRIHLSKSPIYKLEKRGYIQKHSYKPNGFWYGFGNEWIDFVEIKFPEEKGEYVYEVYINSSNVLQIKDYLGIKKFTQKYRFDTQIEPGAVIFINWTKVALEYDGIEINPSVENARYEFPWYSSWDVASGCIWNLNNVKTELVGLFKNDINSKI